MYHVYILKSDLNQKKFYIGYTSRHVEVRLKEHNDGKIHSTKFDRPWKIIYYEAYETARKARIRENKLKQYGSAWGHLKKRILDE